MENKFYTPDHFPEPVYFISPGNPYPEEGPVPVKTFEEPPNGTGGGGGYEDPPNGSGGGGIKTVYKTMIYSGTVRDAVNEQPLPGATVELYAAGQRIDAMAANGQGEFYFEVPIKAADAIIISAVDYKTAKWPASEYQKTFDLERDEEILDPVIVTAGPKNKNTWLFLLLGVVVISQIKK